MPNIEARRIAASPAAADEVGRIGDDGRRHVDASTPWYLDSPTSAWIVRAGRVDLFAVRSDIDERRLPLCSMHEVDAFGADQTAGSGQWRVLAIGIPGTVIE